MALLDTLLGMIRRPSANRNGWRRKAVRVRSSRRFHFEGLEERCLLSGFTLTDLGTLGGNDSRATAINGGGYVVGQSTTASGATHAFLSDGYQMMDLGTLGGRNSYAAAINNDGAVVGKSETANGSTHAFLYSGGEMIDLNPFGSSESYATGINDRGDVVGTWKTADAFPTYHAFIFSNGQMIDPGTLGGRNAFATSINNRGQVIGQSANRFEYSHAFIYRDGEMADLGTLGGIYSVITFSDATSINDAGQVVGGSYNENRAFYHAFAANEKDIADLDLLGTPLSLATSINDWGLAVGHSMLNQVQHAAAFWMGDDGSPEPYMDDLMNGYLDDYAGWTLTVANGINDSAQIVGWGSSPNGIRAFRLDLDGEGEGGNRLTSGLDRHVRGLRSSPFEGIATLPMARGMEGFIPSTSFTMNSQAEEPSALPPQSLARLTSTTAVDPVVVRGDTQETSTLRLETESPSYFDALARSNDTFLAPWGR